MKKLLITLLTVALFIGGCTSFVIKGPDGTEVRATSFITDFDHVEGIFPDGSSFSIDGAKTQVEAAVDAGIKVAKAIADTRSNDARKKLTDNVVDVINEIRPR